MILFLFSKFSVYLYVFLNQINFVGIDLALLSFLGLGGGLIWQLLSQRIGSLSVVMSPNLISLLVPHRRLADSIF